MEPLQAVLFQSSKRSMNLDDVSSNFISVVGENKNHGVVGIYFTNSSPMKDTIGTELLSHLQVDHSAR